jgi:hypothetical protein
MARPKPGDRRPAEKTWRPKGQAMDEVQFDLGSGAAAAWAHVEAEFRRHWENGPAQGRITWEQASWAYRLGWLAAGGPTGPEAKPMEEVDFDRLLRIVRHGWDRRRAVAIKKAVYVAPAVFTTYASPTFAQRCPRSSGQTRRLE